eukprot:15328069-Ditylum_brightwellii.AAC.1
MDATMSLYKLGSCHGNTVSEIKQYLSLFSAPFTASKYEKDWSLFNLKKTIIPFIKWCLNKISSAATISKRKGPPLLRIESMFTGELSSGKRVCTAPTWPSLHHGQKLPSSVSCVPVFPRLRGWMPRPYA